MKTIALRLILAAFACLAPGGCSSYPAGKLPLLKAWPPPAVSNLRSVRVQIRMSETLNGEPSNVDAADRELWTEQSAKVYRESRLFSVVGGGTDDTDLRAVLRIDQRTTVYWAWVAASGLTLSVLPCRTMTDIEVKTTVYDREGYVMGEATRSESIYTWYGLFPLFAMSFQYPPTIREQVVSDLIRASLIELRRSGMFELLPPPR